jgi:hypothetical protein
MGELRFPPDELEAGRDDHRIIVAQRRPQLLAVTKGEVLGFPRCAQVRAAPV